MTTTRVSVDSSGNQGNNYSAAPSISADGRYVAFASDASNLVPDDTNRASDIFVRDLQTGTTRRVSLDSSGIQGNGQSFNASITADGRYVAFESSASNLVSGDTNGETDIFVRDLQTNTTRRVSLDSSGIQSNDFSDLAEISADGRYVAFESQASNLVSGDTNGETDIFVRDLQTNTTTGVSVDSSGIPGNNVSGEPSISADGRFVGFLSYASNLVPDDTNYTGDIFVRDLQLGTTRRVSVDSSGNQGNNYSGAYLSISADGRYVAFSSTASNLVPGDTNGREDVFVRDLQTNTTRRVSLDSSGNQGNNYSASPSISADGRYVAFLSDASNLVPDDTNVSRDVFLRDLQTNTTRRVSLDSSGIQSNGDSYGLSISADGRYVAFYSAASNLVPDDTNGAFDVFVTDIAATSPLVVTNTNDSGAGSLRAAIDYANTKAGADTISFNIPTTDAGYNPATGAFAIKPSSFLPTITDSVILDGTTQTGFSGKPIVELDGSNAGGASNGLVIRAGNSTVKGLVINRFIGNGIVLETNGNNTIAGNYIGTDVTGTLSRANGSEGVRIQGVSNNIIGGTETGSRNLISGNYGAGIDIVGGLGNQILGNYIGTDVTGTLDLGNGTVGVAIDNAPNNTVGGTEPAARNIISGNELAGVSIVSAAATNNRVIGNYIGTDVTGTVDLGNRDGVNIGNAPNNIIGGTEAGARNLISGNDNFGIGISSTNATGNQILGNYIGTDAMGTVDLGNGAGVFIDNAPNNTIGGTGAASRNLISGSDNIGIIIQNPNATGNQILGNYIGTDVTGNADLGNSRNGIAIIQGASNNSIGGTATGAGNTITGTDLAAGVVIATGNSDPALQPTNGNQILGNSIFGNNGLGIDLSAGNLVGDGVNSNDPGDGDIGSNNYQNYPILTSAASSGGATGVFGNLNSLPNTTFRLEFFSNPTLDPSGYGEGRTFLGASDVTTDESGNAAIDVNLPVAVTPGQLITATATNQTTHDTSEFSGGQVVTPNTGQVINGSNANDTLTGTRFADIINGLGGDDILYGLAGIDGLNGGNGNDTLNGGPDSDVLDGGNGSDTYLWSADDGRDTYKDSGTIGIDKIVASNTTNFDGLPSPFNKTTSGIDRIESNQGAFNILGDNTAGDVWDFTGMTLANATIQGRGGDDNIIGTSGADSIQGDNGSDSLSGSGGSDLLEGGDGSDSLNGGDGIDTLKGGAGIDTLDGGNAGDTYIWSAGDGRDVYQDNGSSGTDKIVVSGTDFDGLRSPFDKATSGIERIESTVGNFNIRGDDTASDTWDFTGITLVNATIQGRGGDDKILGTSSADSIQGGDGNDSLLGSGGGDSLSGGSGNDSLNGGLGNDTLEGGTGADKFIFEKIAFGTDTILDFQSTSDRIDISAFGLGSNILDTNGDGFINSSDGFASLVGGNLQLNLTGFAGGGARITFTGLTQINVTDITF